MNVNRRQGLAMLAGAVTAGTAVIAQAPPQAPASPDALLRRARESYQSDAQRIAAIALPQDTEPAFQFRP